MAKKVLSSNQKAIVGEMNQMMFGFTMEDLQILLNGKPFRFPVYPEMSGMDQDVSVADISVRSQNALHRSNLGNIKTLVKSITGEEDLFHLRNMGALSVRDVMFGLFLYQFSLFDQPGKRSYMKRVLEMNGIYPKKTTCRKFKKYKLVPFLQSSMYYTKINKRKRGMDLWKEC